ncbi:MAG: enoyl-CoA hydratase/isomerase family protein [Myxococcota bacterium]
MSEASVSEAGGEGLAISRPRDGVVLAVIDRPPVNQLDRLAREAFLSLIESIEDDTAVRCLVVTGAGPQFCAGADLREERDLDPKDAGRFLGEFGRILSGLATMRVPVIGAVNGGCLGGGLELALQCDLLIASQKAFFVASGVNVGLVASTYALPRRIGVGPASSMLLTGEKCPADRALHFGLVNDVVEPDALRDAALATAERIASRAPLSVEATKRRLRAFGDESAEEAFLAGGREAVALAKTRDHKEALAAHFERRDGRFERR